jgi:hypothetical protein
VSVVVLLLLLVVVIMMIMMVSMMMTTLLYLSGMGIRERRGTEASNAHRISVDKISTLKSNSVLEINSKFTRTIYRMNPFKIHESKADSDHTFNNIVLIKGRKY